METQRSVKQSWLLSCIPSIAPVGTSSSHWGPALWSNGPARGVAPLIPVEEPCTSLLSVLLLLRGDTFVQLLKKLSLPGGSENLLCQVHTRRIGSVVICAQI